MRGPSLQRATFISFTLHLTAILILFLVFKQSKNVVVPSPYVVSLVSSNVISKFEIKRKTDVSKISEKSASMTDRQSESSNKKEIEMVEQKIAAIAAKKKIEQIEKLRSMISLKARNEKQPSDSGIPSNTPGTLFDDYYSKITREIWQQWVFPDIGKKDIEVIVSIKILKDGTVIAQGIEKSSGNTLFDRSALKALAKASPLSPPPYEMEVGVRFYP